MTVAHDPQAFLTREREALWVALDQCLNSVQDQLIDILGEIIQHPDFVRLKSAWFGLYSVVDSAYLVPQCDIEILDLRKEELLEDFEEFLDLSDSGLFFHLYKSEYDQAGGAPYTAVLMQYDCSHATQDLQLLKYVSMVGASCHCPIILNADAELFGLSDLTKIQEITDFDLLFEQAEYNKWRQFRLAEDTRYISMILPKVLVRYRERVRPPYFFLNDKLNSADRAWTYATNAFAMVLIRSFSRHGWCIYIRGPRTGGLVGEIEGADWGTFGFEWHERPVALTFSDDMEHKLSSQGLIPLTFYRQYRRLCIFSAPTLQETRGPADAPGSIDNLAASLPYVFLISRIAHYQKIIQRENIGTVKEPNILEQELENWIKKLITRMPDPDLKLRTQYPLRDAEVKVSADEATPGFFDVRLVIQPHLQLEGVNAQLTLVSKLPRNKE